MESKGKDFLNSLESVIAKTTEIKGKFGTEERTDHKETLPLAVPQVGGSALSTRSREAVDVVFTPAGMWEAWGVNIASAAVWLAVLFCGSSHHLDFKYLAVLAVPVVWLIFIGLNSLLLLQGMTARRIRLDPQGIQFSRYWLNSLFKRSTRPWEDLLLVDYPDITDRIKQPLPEWKDSKARKNSMASAMGDGPILLFHFISGGSANVQLDYLTRAQAIQVFQGLEKWSEPGKLSSKATQLKESLFCDLNGSGYTELWNTDLELRHGSTNFVPLLPNATLQAGRLTVITELSTGGFSAVYLAHEGNGTKVVVKEAVLPVHTSDVLRDKYRATFEREARLLIKLAHPKIVRVFDHFVEQNRDYLVLEHIPGRTLRQIVSCDGRLKEKQLVQIALEIADILAYLHSLEPPVVHRDLTPDNLLLKPDGSVVLIDFGAANEFVGLVTGTMIGKQAYISPEQFRGKAQPQSDIYSFGATLYFLLTGQDPTPLSCSSPVNPASVSNELREIVEKCTQLDLDKRYRSISDVENDLRGLGKTVSERESSKRCS